MKICFSSSRDAIEEKIARFQNLDPGWCFGDGRPFSKPRILSAIKAHSLLKSQGFLDTDAFPGLDGEIRLTAYEGSKYFEFTLETNGAWTYVQEKDGEIVFQEEGLDQTQVEGFIGLLVCGTFASSQLGNIGTRNCTDFKVWHFGRRLPEVEAKAESPSSKRIVQIESPDLFVPTFASSIQESQMTLLSSGHLNYRHSTKGSKSVTSQARLEMPATEICLK